MLAQYKNRELLTMASQLLEQYQDLKTNCQLGLFVAFSFGTLIATTYTYFMVVLVISPCLAKYSGIVVIIYCMCAGLVIIH